MGIAIIIKGADFSAKNLGKVNIIQDVDVESMSIMGDNSYEAASFQLGISYLPLNTNQKGVTWEITSGGQYATIDAVSGVVTILEGANNNNIVVKATNTYKPSVTATKTISVKYKATLDVLNSISVIGDSTINDETHQFAVEFDPANTSYNSVTWSISNGSQYASINQDGLLSVVEGTANKSVTIRATSNHDTSIYGEKTAVVTYAIPPIQFADSAVKAFWVSKADADGDGEVSKAEAAAKTGKMPNNGYISGLTADTFDELKYFGFTAFQWNSFKDCNFKHMTVPSSVTSIPGNSFGNCTIEAIDLNGAVCSFGFTEIHSSLKRVEGGENITSIMIAEWNSWTWEPEYLCNLEGLTSFVRAGFRGIKYDRLLIGNGTNVITSSDCVFDATTQVPYIVMNVASISGTLTASGYNGVVYARDSELKSSLEAFGFGNVKLMSQFATDFPSETETINWINKFSV